MVKLSKEKNVTFMSASNAPIATINDGDTLLAQTKDCFADKIITEKDALCDIPWEEINPCTGPIFINGALPGDILKISILKINLHDKGIMLVDKDYMRKYGYEEGNRSIHIAIRDGYVILDQNYRIPVSPMIGSIGVAPKADSVPTTNPGEHGGNMDCTAIGEGAALYLPVFHEGALLSLGDLHAVMGDGEFTDCGIEAAGEVTLKVEVLKGTDCPTPMVVSKESISMIASAVTVDEAAKEASAMMLKYLLKMKKMPFDLAWGLMCTSANTRVCQFVNAVKTVRCEMKVCH